MAFKGDLNTIGLAELFQTISMSQKQGTLIVQDKESHKAIYFGKDGISLLSVGRRRGLRLGEILVKAGKLSEGQLNIILKLQKKSKKRLGELLIEKGFVTDAEITSIVKSQIEEEIYDLFFWEDATFEFIEGPPTSDLQFQEHSITELTLDVNSLLLEALKRVDEWEVLKKQIPSFENIILLEPSFSEEVITKILDEKWKPILSKLSNGSSIREIAEASGFSKIEIWKFLIELVNKGYISILPPKLQPIISPESLIIKKPKIQLAKVVNYVFIVVVISGIVVAGYFLKPILIEMYNRLSETKNTPPPSISTPPQDPVKNEVEKIALKNMEQLYKKVLEEYSWGNFRSAINIARQLRSVAETNNNQDYLLKANEILESIDNYINESQGLLQKAKTLEKEEKFREASLAIQDLIKKYPNSDAAKMAYFPMQIISKPSKARLFKNNSDIGETPLKMYVSPWEVTNLRLEKKGYETITYNIEDKTAGKLLFELRKTFLWRTSLGGIIDTTPVLSGAKILITNKSQLCVLNASKGQLLWSFTSKEDIEVSPQLSPDKNIIYFGSNDCYLYAIELGSNKGKELWKFKAGDFIRSTPLVSSDGGTIYFGSRDKFLYAVDAKNSTLFWKHSLPAEIRATPKVYKELVFVGCMDGTLRAIKSTENKMAWEFKTDSAINGAPLIVGNTLIFGNEDGNVYAFNCVSGEKMWENKLGDGINSSPAILNEAVFFGSKDGFLYFLNLADGKEKWRYKTNGAIYSAPVISKGEVFIGSDDSYLYCLDANSGELIWKFKMQDKIRATPYVTENMIYIGSYDRNFYVIERN